MQIKHFKLISLRDSIPTLRISHMMLTTVVSFLICCFIALVIYRWNMHRKFNNIRLKREKTFLVRTRCTVEHLTTTIQQTASEIWKISSTLSIKEGHSRLVYIMIPGNPGASSAYVHWMQILVSLFVKQQSNTYDAMDVYVISHANHFNDPYNYNQNKLFTLQDQIKHKIDCIKYITDKYKWNEECHYVFAGHSIGAFIALKIQKHFESIHIKQIHLWAPTIVNLGKSRHGLQAQDKLRRFGSLLPILQFVLSHVLPFWIAKLFLSPALCNTDIILRGVQCKNARFLLNMIYMAQHEFNEVIGSDRTEMDRLLTHHRKQIVFYWARMDGWVHEQCRIDIKDLFKKQNDHEMNEIFAYWEVDSDIKHAMMMDEDSTKDVEVKLARKILDWVHHY
eukprot:1147005_1